MSSLLDKVRGNLEAAEKNQKNHEHDEKPRHAPREKKPTEVKLAEVADDDNLVVRNCSTNEVMQDLCTRLGLTEQTRKQSGRYLKLSKSDLPAFQEWAGSGGFFVKESRIDSTVIYDLMVDNSNRFHQNHHKKA